MGEEDIIKYLKVSSERAGRLYPVLVDKHGNVIDGLHRLAADEKWPKVTVEGVETEEQRLIARLVSKVCRRNVPAKEKREMLGRLGEIYLNEGVEQGNSLQDSPENWNELPMGHEVSARNVQGSTAI